ncbi:Magnesium chelatase [Methylotenera mobilis JLW8]|uniref:Magnesium chelatase n=1 Tax=Methylotenera mobilis (strain JLW8 / ATCC BAA-1282 / DSM 17540) TaxID=583345 RepID=C6WSU4_METML|nr:Magnesium chelatase [Methylotenera mobilis JLW8]
MLLGLFTGNAHSATLLGIVSDRTAPAAAEAAKNTLAQRPGDRIVLRSQSQMMAADSRTLKRWLQEADAVFAVAQYAESSAQLQRALDALKSEPSKTQPATFIAFNGDSALSLRSRFNKNAVSEFAEAKALTQTQEKTPDALLSAAKKHAAAAKWLALSDVWQAGGQENLAAFMTYLLTAQSAKTNTPLPVAKPMPPIRLRVSGKELASNQVIFQTPNSKTTLAVLDLSTSDPQVADAICAQSQAQGINCVVVMAKWGEASKQAIEKLPSMIAPSKLTGLVVLQDFVVGAAEGRESVTALIKKLDVPMFKAIRLTDRSATAWQLSEDGLPSNSIQYRVAMPEVQGNSQPMVVAAAGAPSIDKLTGVELRLPELLPTEVKSLVSRVTNWQTLQSKANAEKRVAIIYYNHPPGRHNIGADNLDVPQSLFDILHSMQAAGYQTGELPATHEALLDLMQDRGVNLPENNAELASMLPKVASMDSTTYAHWFNTLPTAVKGEMVEGPLGRLHADIVAAQTAGELDIARNRLAKSMRELHHLVEGVDHPQRAEALKLLAKLNTGYENCLTEHSDCKALDALKTRITNLNIEGMRGWGPLPGKVMVNNNKMVFPGIQFGNVFVGPQPPRGWEVDEELLHANTTIPPPHQYLGFYHWLKDTFKADALVHLGRHSTYEFLPGKAVGLSAEDYSRIIASDLPGLYPYIVDGVGEGTQAKRRALTVMIDHLTPPLTATPLYDRLLTLRQVVESYESSSSDTMRIASAKEMRRLVETLELRAELESSMADVLKVRGINFEQADDDLLAHEVGHYLTKLQEKFMPHGLHVFGRPWSDASLQLMLDSMAQNKPENISSQIRENLIASPKLEMQALLHGLAGGFIEPGKGNDPLRSPESLPTGRNFHALDGDVLPTPLGFELGHNMAANVRKRDDVNKSQGVILWASDAVRDEGVMVSFILSLMGITPEWNSRGIVQKMQLVQPSASDAANPATANVKRYDVIVTTSGLFRDLYPNLMQWIDIGGRMALAASADSILQADPSLAAALNSALKPLVNYSRGHEPMATNGVAIHWVKRTQALLAQGMPAEQAGREAAWRIFGDAPGAYGAGVNTLAERSGAWNTRNDVGRAYLQRMGHAYGVDAQGEPAHEAFDASLHSIATTYHGRASNLYGLMDNNDAFDYLGGLSLAIETITGNKPEARILNHANQKGFTDEPLESALLMELRGRYLNPSWIKPLMGHGYAGARTMNQAFMENLWGWQVTRPDIIKDWAWNEVKRVYIDDDLKLGLDKFLAQGHNAQVKANMVALMLVAAQKGFWKPSEANAQQLSQTLARLVIKNGLPGSGHTAPNHPMWEWMGQHINAEDKAGVAQVLAKARGYSKAQSMKDANIQQPAALTPAEAVSNTVPKKHSSKAIAAQPKAAAAKHEQSKPINKAAQAYELTVATVKDNLAWILLLLPIFALGLWFGTRKPSA